MPARVPHSSSPHTPSVPTPIQPPLPKHVVIVPHLTNKHSMTTRAKTSFGIPKHLNLLSVSPIPSSTRGAFADPHWAPTMREERGALV